MTNKKQQEQCPYCGNKEIAYSSVELDGSYAIYPATCLKCNKSFKECYTLVFDCMTDENGDEIKD